MSAQALRVGWCPGALRPMASGDGLILRVKPRCATLTPEQALGVAGGAARHGNGLIDLTARANLQIRGVADAGVSALQAELDALGLVDADAGAESRRNVVASPLMGLDPAAAFDVRPAVAALEAALAAATGLAALPGKFGFAVSDGGVLALDDVSADVRFDARPDGRFAVSLDGAGGAVADCDAAGLPGAALRLARAFAEAASADPGLHRMRDLVAEVGVAEIAVRAGSAGAGPVAPSNALRAGSPSRPAGMGPVPLSRFAGEEQHRSAPCPSPAERGRGTAATAVEGADRAQVSVGVFPVGPAFALAAAAPFGRLDAGQLDLLARGAARAGATELRVSPARALIAPGLGRAAAERLAEACAGAGLIVDPADPRLRVAACAGAPGCRRGSTPTLEHAARFARLLGPGAGIALHVSGCAKGCAHPGAAPLTLVAEAGRYALVADGPASGEPAARGLDPDEARRLLKTTLRLDRDP